MRMYFLHSTITLLLVIAHVHCGTLRQYEPDWLIPKPEPQVDSKRITAKSVFIAPNFPAQNVNVRCASGFREDASGRCVKLVHVNQAAQLDFLLQRLNAMYGAPVVNHSDKQPLQVAVGIPEEPVDGDSVPHTEEMYSPAVIPPGHVSVDLLGPPGTENPPEDSQQTTSENATKDINSPTVTVEEQSNEAGLTTVLPVSGNETDPIFTPNKELFQVDEEPLVSLTDIDPEDNEDLVENTTLQSENVTRVDSIVPGVELPDSLLSVNSEDAGVMANITKNTSIVVKKETILGDDSVSFISESVANQTFITNHTFNETHSDQGNQDSTLQNGQMVHNKNELVSHTSNTSANASLSLFTTNKVRPESDESTAEVPFKSSDTEYVASSNIKEVTTIADFTPATSSTMQESSPESSTTEEPTTEIPTTQQSKTTTQEVTPTLETTESNNATTGDHIWDTNDGQVENNNNNKTNEEEYDDQTQDADVEADIPHDNTSYVSGSGHSNYDEHNWDKRFPEHVLEGSADQSLVPSTNSSVNVDSSKSTVDISENERINLVKNGSELLENNGSVKTNSSSMSTESTKKTVIKSGVNVSKSNGTFEESLSASHITNAGVKISPNVREDSVTQQEVLKADSTVHNIEIRPYEYSEMVHNVSQEVQEQSIITPEHSVQVVYSQPVIQVMTIKPDPQVPPIDTTNPNKPSTVFKESVSQNLPPNGLQFHNLNPIPNLVQHANFNPLPQMPLVEKAPELPPKYGGYPYPPLPPLNEMHPPNIPPYRRPQYPIPYQNPALHHYPPDRPNTNGQSGFVRFPTETIQPLHTHHHIRDDEVNTVRFPQEDVRSNGKYSRWGNNWRYDESRGQSPTQRYWAGAGGLETQYPQATNRRNYWVDSRPNRRRPQQHYY